MNDYEAKIELLQETPQIPLQMIAIEAVARVAIAGILVRVFALFIKPAAGTKQ